VQLTPRDVFSQFGEDGLIEGIFAEIGITNRWCFEVGAADGVFYSNTKLWRDQDWSAVLVEAHLPYFEKLKAFENERVRCVCERIGPDSLDHILADAGAPIDLDLGIIDIDGQDWWIFDGLKVYKPRCLMVEIADGAPEEAVPPIGGPGQAGQTAIVELGKTKGYRLVATTKVNALFVREDL